MPSTPSSSSSPSSLFHTTPAATSSPPPSSSPSTGIPSRDGNVNAIAHANVNVNTVATHHHDLQLPPPAAPISSACAACKYQRRKCGPQCMLAPYFPPERQQEFQNAHRLFGVSNIVKKLRKLSPPDRQKAVNSMVFEANMHAADPSGGCLRIIFELENKLSFLNEELAKVQNCLAFCRGEPSNSETDQHEQTFADQSRSSFVSLDDVNPGQNKLQDQVEEQRLHDYFFFDCDITNGKSNNNNDNDNTDLGNHGIMTCNYVNNNDYNEAEQEISDRDEIRPFMDIIPICSDSEEGEEQLVCKSSVDMASLNSALDKSTQCSLGLGFSAF